MRNKSFWLLICIYIFIISGPVFAEQNSEFSILWFNTVVLGMLSDYEGAYDSAIAEYGINVSEVLLNQDEEKGKKLICFTADSSYQEPMILIGSMAQNHFVGPCIMYQGEEKCVEATFDRDGQLIGHFKIYHSDGTSETCKVLEGIPYGFLYSWNNDGEYISKEWYYKGTLLSDWQEMAYQADYHELLSKENDHLLEPVFVEGVVVETLTTGASFYALVSDDSGNVFFFNFPDTEKDARLIPYIKIPEIGDRVIVYGIFNGFRERGKLILYDRISAGSLSADTIEKGIISSNTLSQIPGSNYICTEVFDYLPDKVPSLSIISCVSFNEETDEDSNENTYNSICRYPANYLKKKKNIVGSVIYQSEDKQKLVVAVDENEYYIVYSGKTITGSYKGKKVKCSGILNTFEKLPYYNSEEVKVGYAVFPSIKVTNESNIQTIQ